MEGWPSGKASVFKTVVGGSPVKVDTAAWVRPPPLPVEARLPVTGVWALRLRTDLQLSSERALMNALQKRLNEDLASFTERLAQIEDSIRIARAEGERLKDRIDYIRNALVAANANTSYSPLSRFDSDIFPPQRSYPPSALIREILLEAGSAQQIQVIADKSINKGYGGPNPNFSKVKSNLTSLLAKLTKHPNKSGFRRAGRGMFDLADRQSTPTGKEQPNHVLQTH
jgi:hypothetical protein